MTTAYPLSWPENFPRWKNREKGPFKASLSAALENVQSSLRLFGSDSKKPINGLVISSNVALGVSNPEDPGVAIWFIWDGLQVCIPVDRYSSVQANLQAIHHIVDARRVELRHGTLALVRASFSGFLALPAPTGAEHWSEVLGIARDAPVAEIEAAYRHKAKTAHPDQGGQASAMARLNAAREQARKDRS